jgi:hypothetical protein
VPEYDAFGREIGENTLEGLGGPSQRAKPAEWSAEELAKAQAAARAEAQATAAPPATSGDPLRMPETPRFESPVADPEPAAPQRPVFVPQSTGLRVVRVRRAGLGCLGLFIGGPILLTILGIAAALLFGLSSVDTKTDLIDVPRPSESPEIEAGKRVKPAKPPVGLQAKSLVRRANFARAMRKLRAAGLGSPSSLRVAPERINAQLITKAGRLRNVQVNFDGKLDRQGSATPGFKFVRTVPFAQINTAAPERLARAAARRLGTKASRLDYVSLLTGTGWGAYFKNGRIGVGDARGGFVRRIS